MTKEEIGDVLESIAQLLDLKGENPFKIRAYTQAARALELYTGDLKQAAERHELDRIEGIGKSVAEKIAELLHTGKLAYFEELKAGFPRTIFELFELQGLGAKKIKALYDKLDIASVEQLVWACNHGTVAELPGFGEKTQQKLLAAVEQRRKSIGLFRLGDVVGEALRLTSDLREHPAVVRASEAGSVRRRKEIVRDLDFVVSTREPAEVGEFFATRPEVEEVIVKGPTKVSVRLQSGIQCDLRLVGDTEYPYALHHFTGSKEHHIALRNRALERGWSINDYRFSVAEGKAGEHAEPLPEIVDETSFYRALDLDFIPPELREASGEIEAAAAGKLPELVQLENLRGTFHCHTNASDGKNTLAEMAGAARDLGLQYLGIADHSKASFQANGQDEGRLLAQVEEIRRLNKQFTDEGTDFCLFAGIECDLHKDGTLDFADDILAQLDYVVVSVHGSFQLPQEEMTARLIRAIENPYVTMMGHLTGRLLLQREGYALDIPAVIDAAVRTDTVVELNANGRRLDMDWRWWHYAKEKGLRCAINPDAHRTEGLQDLWLGITQARKGWLTRLDVINCLPLGKIEQELQRKRKKMGV